MRRHPEFRPEKASFVSTEFLRLRPPKKMLSNKRRASCLTAALLVQLLILGAAFLTPDRSALQCVAASRDTGGNPIRLLFSSSPSSSSPSEVSPEDNSAERNSKYVKGLMENLSRLCDKYILSGSPKARERLFNVLDQIAAEALDEDQVHQSIRMTKRAGVPMNKTYLEKYSNELGKTDTENRKFEAVERKNWEEQRSTAETGSEVANTLSGGRSALSRREVNNDKPDLFMNSVLDPASIATIAQDKSDLQKVMSKSGGSESTEAVPGDLNSPAGSAAANRVSELVAKAGAGASFEGETLGIGGLDDVLAQVKRRVWIPLAAPPQLLEELGIHPVRGLLLYGKPGCGKTLLARTLGSILSPMRPITVVSGPEIMDKFVGSSEKNLRDIFDSPPDIYDKYRIGEKDGGEGIARAALHVVVMDEFDAVARTRGGRGGKGDQGDAGVARDSVVNQLLAKMDGVHPLPVPTLVVGLTNKRSLIEPALLRPGRFEVQVEVPPPGSLEQRVSILKVHMQKMHAAGRLLVADPPAGTAAERYLEAHANSAIPSYNVLLDEVAGKCAGYSGAAIAGVARAAASHALERAVNEFSQEVNGSQSSVPSIMDCIVTRDDLCEAVKDVQSSMGTTDNADEETEDIEPEGSSESDANEGHSKE